MQNSINIISNELFKYLVDRFIINYQEINDKRYLKYPIHTFNEVLHLSERMEATFKNN